MLIVLYIVGGMGSKLIELVKNGCSHFSLFSKYEINFYEKVKTEYKIIKNKNECKIYSKI